MTSAVLPVIWNNQCLELEERLLGALDGTATAEEVLAICRCFRRRGIAAFLLRCDAQLLVDDLQRSGACWSAYLATNKFHVVSRGFPFLDAVACRDHETCRAIATRSRDTWDDQYEYQEDYLYFRLLQRRFFANATANELENLLNSYLSVTGNEDDIRWRICAAFLHDSPDDFEEALLALLDQHATTYDARYVEETVSEEEWATNGFLCVEGLALLRLAESCDWPLKSEYPRVPSLCRLVQPSSYSADSWRTP